MRPSEHADFQAVGILPLAKPLRANPRQVATRLAAPRLGIPASDSGNVTVIDYSQPNIARL